MKCDLIIAGVGGQGILSIAAVLGRAVLAAGVHMKQSEVHGMAQRGGAVQAHLRLADQPVHAPLIPRGGAHLLLSMEPMEALRYLAWLSPKGWLVTNSEPVFNIPDYPGVENLRTAVAAVSNSFWFDASALIREAGAPRALNMAMLGAAAPFLPLAPEAIEQAMDEQFRSKSDGVRQTNRTVFRAALEEARARLKDRSEKEAGQA